MIVLQVRIELLKLLRSILSQLFVSHANGIWLRLLAKDYSKELKKATKTCGDLIITRDTAAEANTCLLYTSIEDDNYGTYTPFMEGMGESTALHKEQRVAETVKKGFTDLCYDGQPFYSKTHKVGDTTYSNLTDAQLSADSFAARCV